MAIDVILGLQWGDEGKGKIVDYLASQYDVVARFQGGPNAGHTLKFDGHKFVLHTIPSGIFRKGLVNLIGNGVVIDPITLRKEIGKLGDFVPDYKERLFVSNKAHLILPTHRYIDAASEAAKGQEKIGSTLKGIGPTYMDKTGRNGLRVGDVYSPNFKEKYEKLKEKHMGLLKLYPEYEFDLESEEALWFECLDTLRELKNVDGEYFINQQLKEGKRILAEGAQGSMLDIDFGTYPYVTSSNTVTSGVCNGLGVSPHKIGEVIGITKAYCTRVGGGPFPTELHDETGERLREAGGEFGATTGRPRRCGWIDIPQLNYTIMLNGVTQLVITKIDVLDGFDEIGVASGYEYNGKHTDQVPFDICDGEVKPVYEMHKGWNTVLTAERDFDALPEAARRYIKTLEEKLKVPVSMVSVGPGREQLILRAVADVVK
ncbi:MAG: adenylosuccinate synthase [Bacteroidetes bacterium]|nr:adenylosuccinate synthase [Bacteroidota bacterium]